MGATFLPVNYVTIPIVFLGMENVKAIPTLNASLHINGPENQDRRTCPNMWSSLEISLVWTTLLWTTLPLFIPTSANQGCMSILTSLLLFSHIKKWVAPLAMQRAALKVTLFLKNIFLNKETYSTNLVEYNFVHIWSYGGIFWISTLLMLGMKVRKVLIVKSVLQILRFCNLNLLHLTDPERKTTLKSTWLRLLFLFWYALGVYVFKMC